MSFRNDLEMKNWEYRGYLLKPKPLSPEDGRRAEEIRRELVAFDKQVEEVLAHFDSKYQRSLCAILEEMPGSFDFMFSAWLEQLRGLGILKD